MKVGKYACVYQLCGWEVGQRHQALKTVAFSTISIAPCQFDNCHIPSIPDKGHPKHGSSPCMVIRVSVLSVILNAFAKGRLMVWQQGQVKERNKSEVHLSGRM